MSEQVQQEQKVEEKKEVTEQKPGEEQKPAEKKPTEKKKHAKKEKDNFEMVVNFKRVFMGRRNVRTKRAIKLIRKLVVRHFGAERVIIDPILASAITYNGKDKIVRKIRINVRKIKEKTYLVTLALKSE